MKKRKRERQGEGGRVEKSKALPGTTDISETRAEERRGARRGKRKRDKKLKKILKEKKDTIKLRLNVNSLSREDETLFVTYEMMLQGNRLMGVLMGNAP